MRASSCVPHFRNWHWIKGLNLFNGSESMGRNSSDRGGGRDACLHLCLLGTDSLDCVPTCHVERELVERVPDRKSLIQTSGALP